jgi:NAD(P)-dependent dehydrogenase (short-subunit alcohol dehydrogenase family)
MTTDANTLSRLFGLAGRTAVVTGANTGIGRGIAHTLAAAGARVVVAARNTAAAETVVAEIEDSGGEAIALPVRIDDEASIVALFDAAQAALGRIDILVNNAGVFPETPLLETSGEAWDAIQHINTRGTFLCLREAARRMKAAGSGGSIVNISSIGSIRSPVPGRYAYNASKAAVNRLTEEAAQELAAANIRVNAVLPGPIATEKLDALDAEGSRLRAAVQKKIPLGRWGVPEDIAAAVLYFSSAAGAFVTGQLLVVDGGSVLM